MSIKKIKKAGLAICFSIFLWLPEVYAHGMATDLLTEVVVPPGADYVVMDVLDGVEARYRTMAHDDVYGVYSCAGYVKAYCQEVYGISVNNLIDGGPPQPQSLFTQVQTPQKGDLIFYPSPPSKNNHSAIVKAFDGQRITLIEQDYKWAQNGGTYTYINRTIPYPPNSSHPYEIWRPVFVSDEISVTAPQANPSETFPEDPPETSAPAETYPEEVIPVVPNPEASIPIPEETPLEEAIPENPTYDETVSASAPAAFRTATVTIGRMSITVNGEDMPIDAPALIAYERTVMPVRWVGYALGLNNENIHWDSDTQTVTVNHGNDVIIFTIGSYLLNVNYQPASMDCPAFLHSDRAYLPVRFLAEALGVTFAWDSDSRSVTFYQMLS